MPTQKRKPVVYIASPYTKGDVALNVRFQMAMFDRLLTDGNVLPVAPLWSHFQHLAFPRRYEDWLEYDLSLIKAGQFDACLRQTATHHPLAYEQSDSSGADREVQTFTRLGLPVFRHIADLYQWTNAVWPALTNGFSESRTSVPSAA